MRHARRLLAGVSSLVVGCTGAIGAPGGGDDPNPIDPGSNPTSFVCDPDVAPSPTPLRRLSRIQYDNALHDLVAQTLGSADASTIAPRLVTALGLVPSDIDPDHAGLSVAVTQPHIDGQYQVALVAAAELTANDDRLQRLAGACAVDGDPSNDAVCADDLIASFGERAFRRPLEPAEIDFYRTQVLGTPPSLDRAAVADLMTVMLLAPSFLYHMEDGGEAVAGDPNAFPLTPYELASRLSFHFWQTMPDEALFAAARDGSLATESGFAAQVDRLYADPRTTRALDRFFAEWIRLDDIPDVGFRNADPAYAAFLGDPSIGPGLRDEMIEEVLDMTRYYRDEGGSLTDLFLSDRSFARGEALASIYGVEPWTGGEPPAFTDGARTGLLTRSALLSTSYLATRPIHKGVIVRMRVLCDTLGQPPADIGPPPELTAGMTIRQQVEELTQQEGSSCAGCHAYLNPLGFPTEEFDAIGRLRTEETVYDDQGNVVARTPVDASSRPRVDEEDDGEIVGGAALNARVAESDKLAACFSRHYFRFTWRRTEDFTRDACTLESYRTRAESGSLRDVLRDAVLDPAFRMRHRP